MSAGPGKIRIVRSDAFFPEGPWVQDGVLYYAEYGGDRISTWDGSRHSVFWQRPGAGPSAIARLGDNFLVACFNSGEVALVSNDGKTLSIYDKDRDGRALIGPNDATDDGKGGLYFTLSGPWTPGPIVGRVMHMSPGGLIRQVADDLHFANGLTRSHDGRQLLVNESEASQVISFTIEADGSLSDRRLFVRLRELGEAPDAYPDGIKRGPDGCYYIGLYSTGRVVVMSPQATLVKVIAVPSVAAPNITFSQDGLTLFVMAVDDKTIAPYRGKVYAIDL